MPYHVAKSSQCPTDKPWAVIKDNDGKIMGCHMTEDDAGAQLKALYANEASAELMIERRFQLAELRIEDYRAEAGPKIVGHAAVFNQKSEEIFGFREIVLPGAFAKTIKKNDVRALWNHDPNFVLGRKKNGTLSLSEDDVGLRVKISPPETSFAADVVEMIRRGDVDQMSFGFRTITDKWRKQDGETIRELVEVDLFDVSPVTFPAYPQTDVSARSYFQAKISDLERKTAPKDPTDGFLEHSKQREEFLARRAPAEDPFSLKAILKSCMIAR